MPNRDSWKVTKHYNFYYKIKKSKKMNYFVKVVLGLSIVEFVLVENIE